MLSPYRRLLLFVFFGCCLATSTATLDPVDYLSLQLIARSLSDLPTSRFFVSWDFTKDPCASFAGVACSGGSVVSLALGDPRAGAAGRAGTFPGAAISRLSALSALSLTPGRVAGELSASVARLPSLRFLAVAGNLLSGDIPAAFAPALQTLDLSRNRFSGRIPAALLRLPELQTVVLAHNFLSGDIPASVSSPLVHVDFKNNVLSGRIPMLPPSVRYLSLANNRLSGEVGPALRRLRSLNFLDLGSNQLAGEIPGEVLGFPAGVFLQFRRNYFSGELRMPRPVAAGATVDVSHNRIGGKIPAGLAAAEKLYLNGNRFVGSVPPEITGAAAAGRMKVLYVQDNFLTAFRAPEAGRFPASVAVCAHWNCLAPPAAAAAACPVKGGRFRRRPALKCRQ